mmetsp:Transcript_15877/g.23911  ORF Transcript_15877/g.23911 Transcript_15877/m.23911 type:complete len:253 (+) Transcript_15877:1005-1763(+)
MHSTPTATCLISKCLASSDARVSVSALPLTNISTFPALIQPSIRQASHGHLCASSGTISTICLMSGLDCPRLPMTIRIGFLTTSLANPSIFFFIVALNNKVCRSGRMLLTMDRIWYSNPSSNILSASSSTTIVHRFRFVDLFDISSINLPGVAITISGASLSAFAICHLPSPPYTAHTLILNTLANFLASEYICVVSSLVGESTRPIGPSPSSICGWSSMWIIIGHKKLRVLPEPVLANPMISLPLNAAGSA